MNKKFSAFFALLIILAFISYIIFDATSGSPENVVAGSNSDDDYPEMWQILDRIPVNEINPTSVAVSDEGVIFLAGESFVKSLTPSKDEQWRIGTGNRVTALAVSGDTLFAATSEAIILISTKGEILGEWGPYESDPIITSISADKEHVAFADAGNKRVFILKKNGEVSSMLGQTDNQFVVPSPYFDVAISGNTVFVANTGHRRIETWTLDGKLINSFGEAGTAPGAFCGCCNPSHFALIPQGFITAEKGINRIKILDNEGNFTEYVSSENNFAPAYPLDIASTDGNRIYAVNSFDTVLYIFIRK